MPTLLQQHIFELTQALIVDPLHDDCDIMKKIVSTSRISPDLALEIYRNNTRGARVKTVEIVYPACKSILGDDTFHAIASEFVNADSVGASDLNHYGETFGQYLGELVETGRLPAGYAYLHDLARLEYSYHAAYYADADPVFDFGFFERAVKSGQPVYFRLSASLGMLATQYPVYDIWQLNRPVPGSGRNTSQRHDVQAINATQYLLVHREHDIPVVVPVGERQYCLLEAFSIDQSLQFIIGQIDGDVDVLLPGLIANRWIVGVRHDE